MGYEIDGSSLEDAIEYLTDRLKFVEANNGTATIDWERGGYDDSGRICILIDRDITKEEIAAREERARTEIKALEANRAARAKAEYTLYTNLKIKYEGGA